jgi:hypothetical protein
VRRVQEARGDGMEADDLFGSDEEDDAAVAEDVAGVEAEEAALAEGAPQGRGGCRCAFCACRSTCVIAV